VTMTPTGTVLPNGIQYKRVFRREILQLRTNHVAVWTTRMVFERFEIQHLDTVAIVEPFLLVYHLTMMPKLHYLVVSAEDRMMKQQAIFGM